MKKPKKLRLLWSLFFAFLKISPVSFGGGYAMIPLLENEVTEKKKWIKREDVTDVLVMAQTVPGSIAVNTATFIGYRLAGIPGAVVATLGIVTPTFLIVLILAILFLSFKDQPLIDAAFQGIRPAIIAMIAFAAINIGKSAVYNRGTAVVAILSFIVFLLIPVHPIFVLIAGGVMGIFVHREKIASENRRKKRKHL